MAKAEIVLVPDGAGVLVAKPGLGYRKGKLSPRVIRPIAQVVHTTGVGINARFAREGKKKGDKDAFDTAVRAYTTIMSASGHYVVGQGPGQLAQIVPENFCAWHVGGAGANVYIRDPEADTWNRRRWDKAFEARHAWWLDRWAAYGLRNPCMLAGGHLWDPYVVPPTLKQRVMNPLSWAKGSANANTIAWEVVPPIDNGSWSDDCWETLTRSMSDAAERNGIPISMLYQITHSDAHPIARTTKTGRPWDTAEQHWSFDHFLAWRQRLGLAAPGEL